MYIEIVVYVYEKTSFNKIKFLTEDYISNYKNITTIYKYYKQKLLTKII